MELPILEQGRRLGWLRICREGLYTRFEASLPLREGMNRLFVHGGGESGCLGLLAPRGKSLILSRRLSRLEMEKLPNKLEYASLSPEGEKPGKRPPQPKEKPVESGWKARPDGSLVLERERLLALPCEIDGSREGLRILRLGDREYLVFRY